ncbi:MAG: tyrosine--tRNA ligase [Nitrospirae bacterium RBG_13_39_12]|nr:MAG: tyrosine--tRNA ligase [Nitrospirae bacterium RBG_13_39_12]
MLKPEEQLEAIKRGAVEIIIEGELLQKLKISYKEKRPLKIKAGFDPTAPDIHLGHTVLLEKMWQFQELGHEVIFLIGDFTGMIGDPSGKNEMRKPLTKEEVLDNAKTYEEQIFKILDPDKTRVVFNSEWMSRMTAGDMIKLASSYTVARMLERDDFKQRWKNQNPISIHEFMYPLIQGYDSVVLQADVELGGTDQKFNLIVGRELQKGYGQELQCLVIMPLLEGLDGVKKMSKSLGNYIGITENSKDMYGKIMSINDELMLRYYELLSHLSVEKLNSLKEGVQKGSIHPKKAKEDLALEIVERYWGKEKARKAKEEFEHIHREKGLPDHIPTYESTFDVSSKTSVELDITITKKINWLPQIMKETGLAKSTSEAIRLIKQAGVKINDTTVTDPDIRLQQGEHIIRVGKRRFYKVIVK